MGHSRMDRTYCRWGAVEGIGYCRWGVLEGIDHCRWGVLEGIRRIVDGVQ